MSAVKVELRYVDKSKWGKGPWQNEPDKLQWTDKDTGLPCLIVRGPTFGNLCGYVGVEEGHPYYGKEGDDIPCDVHGGVSYAAPCQTGPDGGPANRGVCHVPEPGATDKVWWIGFDCAHGRDYCPGQVTHDNYIRELMLQSEVYRNIAYVRKQVRHLAAQLARVRP